MLSTHTALRLLLVATAAPFAAAVWPQPQSLNSGSDSAALSSAGFAYAFEGPVVPDTLAQAFDRYAALTFPHNDAGSADASFSLTVSVDSPSEAHPQLETDEAYSLNVTAAGAALHASTVYGALRGLETFSQLVAFDFDAAAYSIPNVPLTIQDAPRFPHRGLMLDTARHFEPLATIRRVIDSMPYAKLNVLHWHLVDSQSFPFESKSHPKLWDGAYSPAERYLQADIADVVEFARMRGVRVMPEFDMPGHAASWCAGYPEICPAADCNQPLNVASNATFDLIEALLGECTGGNLPNKKTNGLFPDGMLHLGGDEVDTTCWGKNADISAWLAARNMTEDDGYAYFVQRAASIAIAQGRRPVQWVEVFDHFHEKLAKSTIVHVWKDKSTLPAVVSAGYNALINNSPGNNSWYLDHLDIAWEAVYLNEPCSAITIDAECDLVLGGQGEMWGETVDASDIEQTVWPKMAAIAERLWSPRAVNDSKLALPRIQAFRCLLNQRGVAAAPVLNANARSAPPGPGGCYVQ